MENEMKPEIRFKEFTNAWEQRKFGDCVLIQRGGSPRPIENYITKGEEGINWVKIGDVSADSRYITCTKEKIIPEGEKFSRRVQIGDLILSNSMSFGRPYIMAVDGCIHDGWLLIRDNNNLFYQEYLLQLLSSNYMYSQYRSLASGGVVNNLNSDLVQSITALIPNKEEQSKLGAFFRNLDNLIALHQRKCDKLKNVKKSLLEKMFPAEGKDVPEIRFKEFTDAWEQRIYGDIGQCFSGGNLSYDSLSSEGKNKCVLYGELYTTYDCIIKDVVNRTDFVGNTIYKNDILFPQSTTVDADSLISPACLNDERAETSGVFVIRPKENIDGNFVCYYSKGNSKQRAKLAKKAQGLTIVHLYYQSIKDEEIFIPSHVEQEKISKLFSQLDSLVALHQRKCEKLKNIKKALLEKMFC